MEKRKGSGITATYLQDLKFEPDEFRLALQLWGARYMEHCLVLVFYLQNLDEKTLEGTPLAMEKNTYETDAVEHLKQWKPFVQDLERIAPNQVVPSQILSTFSMLLQDLIAFKQVVVEIRKAGHHPGALPLVLLLHMLREGIYIQKLLDGTLTLSWELEFLMNETFEHVSFVALQIEGLDEKQKQTTKRLTDLVIQYEGDFKTKQNNDVQLKNFRHLNQELQQLVTSSWSPSGKEVIFFTIPLAFIQHELLEAAYFEKRLMKHTTRSVQKKNLIDAI
jgi:hypothetical protein